MKISAKHIPAAVTLGTLLLLTACGGGGGGTSASTGTSTTTASTITSSNAQKVGSQAYSNTSSLAGEANVGPSLLTGVSISPANRSLLDVVLQQTYRAMANKPATSLVTGVSSSGTTPCSGGGTVTASYSIANSSTISAGDTVSMQTANCVESGSTLNGSMTIVFGSFTGTLSSTGAWSAAMTITFSNLSVQTSSDTELVDGDLSLTYTQTDSQTASYTAGGNSLQLTTISGGVTETSTVTAYSYTGSTSGTLNTYSANFVLRGSSGQLGNGAYTVKTLTPFKQNGNSYPYQGVMTITATDNTSVKLTALDSTSVKLEIDTNGDGTIDETKTITWAQLASSAI